MGPGIQRLKRKLLNLGLLLGIRRITNIGENSSNGTRRNRCSSNGTRHYEDESLRIILQVIVFETRAGARVRGPKVLPFPSNSDTKLKLNK